MWTKRFLLIVWSTTTTGFEPFVVHKPLISKGVKLNRGVCFGTQDQKPTEWKSRNYSEFGGAAEIIRGLDASTGGFALSYAPLGPGQEGSAAGVAFLFTNVFFLVSGLVLGTRGDAPQLGCIVDLAGTMSIWYHWSQLRYGEEAPEVRVALLADYLTAIPALLGGMYYAVSVVGLPNVPPLSIGLAFAATGSLLGSWVDERPQSYMLLHGGWHVASAAAGYFLVS